MKEGRCRVEFLAHAHRTGAGHTVYSVYSATALLAECSQRTDFIHNVNASRRVSGLKMHAPRHASPAPRRPEVGAVKFAIALIKQGPGAPLSPGEELSD